MKTKKLNEKELLAGKLLSYSAAAGALFAIGQKAEAQIVYTDVDPDETVAAEPMERGVYDLDINNDGTVDVKIVHDNGDIWAWPKDEGGYVYFWASVRGLPQTGVELATVMDSSVSYAPGTPYTFCKRFDFEDAIGPELDFKGVSDPTSYSSAFMFGFDADDDGHWNSGEWQDGEPDKYLGVRFTLDEGATYNYGWVRLDVAEDHSEFTVKDYAYESTAGTVIPAGRKFPVSIKEAQSKDLGIKVFSFDKKIIIKDLDTDNVQAKVFNSVGQLVHSSLVNSGRNEIQIQNEGLYFVKLKVNDKVITNKVIVK